VQYLKNSSRRELLVVHVWIKLRIFWLYFLVRGLPGMYFVKYSAGEVNSLLLSFAVRVFCFCELMRLLLCTERKKKKIFLGGFPKWLRTEKSFFLDSSLTGGFVKGFLSSFEKLIGWTF